ncbi:hypothetical protein H0H87_004453 [Tephrocybe sp. NHM501043]|nr:hypothetical protein H0H87_004453 [Tephrocybe sp. NHM501043]
MVITSDGYTIQAFFAADDKLFDSTVGFTIPQRVSSGVVNSATTSTAPTSLAVSTAPNTITVSPSATTSSKASSTTISSSASIASSTSFSTASPNNTSLTSTGLIATTSTSSPSQDAAAATGSHTVPIGPIVGGAVGGVIVILLIILGILFFTRRRGKRAREIIDIEYEGPADPKIMALASQVTPFPGARADVNAIGNLTYSHSYQTSRSQSITTNVRGSGLGHGEYLAPVPAPSISQPSSVYDSASSYHETSTTASRSDVPYLPSRPLLVVGGAAHDDPELPPEYSEGSGPSRVPWREKITYTTPPQEIGHTAGGSSVKS